MKRFLPIILIVITLLQLLAPFGVNFNGKSDVGIKNNKAEAVEEDRLPFDEEGYKKAFPKSSLTVHSQYYEANDISVADIDIKIDTGIEEGKDSSDHWMHTEADGATYLWGLMDTGVDLFDKNDFILVIQEVSTKKTGWINATSKLLSGTTKEGLSYDFSQSRTKVSMPPRITSNKLINSTGSITPIGDLTSLIPGDKYTVDLYYKVWSGNSSGVGFGENIPTVSNGGSKDYIKIASTTFEAASKLNQQTGGENTMIDGKSIVVDGAIELPECTLISADPKLGGCIAQGIYYLFFKTTSFVFGLAGRILDFSLMYSTSDSAYRSTFVIEGWGVVRDFCNMFFIFVLLYIAFGTILNLHSVKTKEMIINVVIIGLLINFSLFAVHVIIDASNILTRVFYNQNTIVTGSKDPNTGVVTSELGDFGEIKLSEAIVSKVNPQKLIIQAQEVEKIPIRGTAGNEDKTMTSAKISTGTFILVSLLATAVNVVGIIAFLTSAFIFISRVIGLWLAMILAPLAFFSYTIPQLQDVKMIGWKKWWPETIKLAFLGPVFVFFMYLIVGFMDKGLGIINATTLQDGSLNGGLSFVIAIVVPFIFIMILLMKAKDIAKDMSGEVGQSITNGIATVGGVALGAGIGGLAMAGRSTLGRVANKINNSNWVNDAAAGKKGANPLSRFAFQSIGKVSKQASNATAKSSFDFRQTKAGNAFSKETGMNLNTGTNLVGLDTKKGLGGYAGVQQRKVEKENKFGESLGYNHHLSETIQDNIDKRKKDISDAERDRDMADAEVKKAEATFGIGTIEANSAKEHHGLTMAKVTALKNGGSYTDPFTLEKEEIKNGLAGMEKDLERNKTGRAKEYALTMKRKSGRIYKHVERDENDNIKKFGHAESSGKQAAKQIVREFAKGFAQGAATGAIAGSIIPGAGTLIGAGAGGLIGAVRSTVINYSGTTNRKTGDESHGDKHEAKDNYNPGISHSAPKADSHAADSHDAHADEHH